MKENNGRAARRRIFYRLLGGLCCLVGIATVIWIVLEVFAAAVATSPDSRGEISAEERHSRFRKKWKQMQAQKRQHGDNNSPGWDGTAKEVILKQILQGHWQLINVIPDMEWLGRHHHRDDHDPSSTGDYEGFLRGVFCPVDWSSHEQDPSATPMFRDVLAASRCDYVGGGGGDNSEHNTHTMDLYQVVQAAKLYDQQQHQQQRQQQQNSDSAVLPLAGVVFHESRCGSTLLANLMQWHNPTENIVYSESPPPITILGLAREHKPENHEQENESSSDRHQQSSSSLWVQLLRDVIYLMSRRPASRPEKRRVFFKIQSAGTPSLGLFRQAFPDTPWIFAYRDPVEVMSSHLDQAGNKAICVRSQRQPPKVVANVVAKYSTTTRRRARDLTYTEYCAAHLASLTEQAVHELEQQQQQQQQQQSSSKFPLGMAVNYRDLPDLFTHSILPRLWNLTVDESALERMTIGSTSYSKGRGNRAGQTFVQDSQAKQEHASIQLKQAAQTFLQPSYEQLELWATRAKQQLLLQEKEQQQQQH